MKLLLIEDDVQLVNSLSQLLRKNGYLMDIAPDGETGFQLACTGTYDIIILDRMLPMRDGLSLLKEFRSLGHETSVLFLTTMDSPEERAEGLNAGADDYLGIPFFVAELLARLQALSRRKNKRLEENFLIADNLKFDPRKSQVIKGNEVIKLTLKEAQLLELLMSSPNQVVTKERIAEKVWGYYVKTDMAVVNLYIYYLRKKLTIANLKTIRGIGYCLETNPTRENIAD